MQRDEVKYARSGDLRIAYQTFGDGPFELVIVPGFISNLDMVWESPAFAPVLERFAPIARCLVFDKRGTGLSDRELGFGSLEERMDDIRAVVETAGFERPAVFAFSEGGPLSLLYAATYPERVRSLVLYGTMARVLSAPDYPEGVDRALALTLLDGVEERWGTGSSLGAFVQHIPNTPEARDLIARYGAGSVFSRRVARSILERNIEIDVRPILPTVSAPTLVLHSAGDPLIPVTFGRYIAAHVPGARYVEHDADYHMTHNGADAWFLDDAEEFLTGHRPAAAPSERVLATVLFTDIVGSTEHAAAVGDQSWRHLLDEHDAVTAQRVAAFDGRLVKTTGDGVLATFDGPSRAVACAQSIRDAVADLELQVRAGVHTGELERRGDDVGGIGVHIGSRIAGLAAPGEVWVSRTVKDLTAGSGLTFTEQGRHELKGVPDEWELYSLTA